MVLRSSSVRGSDGIDRPKLYCVLGPYWPFLLIVTLPLIIGISAFVAVSRLPNCSTPIRIVWAVSSGLMVLSLFFTACMDPGILLRHSTAPDESWVWSDQALSYRPRNALYDPECAVVLEHFDHVCPWTGTAIAKKNMKWFWLFVVSVLVSFVVDIVLITFR